MFDFLHGFITKKINKGQNSKVLATQREQALEINTESFLKIINSTVVPEDSLDGLVFLISESDFEIEVTIKKPYIDNDGDDRGNMVLISYITNQRVISIGIENGYFYKFYRDNPSESFKMIDERYPSAFLDQLNKIWLAIIEKIKIKEANVDLMSTEHDNIFTQRQKIHNFEGFEAPHDLYKLVIFQTENKIKDGISQGFFLNFYEYENRGYFCSDSTYYIANFIEFATANGTGSIYALWAISNELNNCPVVVIGDEGGIFIVAENICQLFHLLTYDEEISISHEFQSAFFIKNNDFDHQESEHLKLYLEWVKQEFNLDPITSDVEADAIIEHAQRLYQDDFLQHWQNMQSSF